MVRKSSRFLSMPPVAAPEWDPDNKESWHLDFEKENVNDDKWTCIVTAAIPSEAQDEECIQTYTECVDTGLRKAVKIISMADVVKFLKESSVAKVKKEEGNGKPGKLEKTKTSDTSYNVLPFEILDLAFKYATFTDTECKLPPDLMAAVLKFMILQLKDESCARKRVEMVRERKIREQNIKIKFIRDLKPYKNAFLEGKISIDSSTQRNMEESINDEPIPGPNLYIMLVDFYELSLFPELLKINIPVVAFIKIVTNQYELSSERFPFLSSDSEEPSRKNSQGARFWERLKEESSVLESTTAYRDIAMMQFLAPPPATAADSKQYRKEIFDELTWMQYSAHCIYRQHQKFLQEMYVQSIFLSLERLDLSTCNVYNKLCDALITGEPLTPMMVLYAIVEQVVVGVPETESVCCEYHPKPTNFFSKIKRRMSKKRRITKFSIHVLENREKLGSIFSKHKESRASVGFLRPTTEDSEPVETIECPFKGGVSRSVEKLLNTCTTVTQSSDYQTYEALIDDVLSERITEKEFRAERKWKTPVLCSYGDSVFSQSFYCDRRLFDPVKVVERFLLNSDFFHIWSKYPELPPEERAYYNHHFFKLWKISRQREDKLKLKIFFMLSTKFVGISRADVYRAEEENISELVSGRGMEELMKFSKVRFDQSVYTTLKDDKDSFSNYFFKTFIFNPSVGLPRKAVINIHSKERLVNQSARTDFQVSTKITNHFNTFLRSYRGTWTYSPNSFKLPGNVSSKSYETPQNQDKDFKTLFSLLECFEITSLTEIQSLLDNQEHLNLIKCFKFYEKLEPNLMIQRILEAGTNFNTIQSSYFLPTDTVIITMSDDSDHRGRFCTSNCSALPTPVSLRDFYNYVYPEISTWLVNETAEHSKFKAELAEKLKAQEEKENEEYLAQLTAQYYKMNCEKKAEFLETNLDNMSQPRIAEWELGSLPSKPKLSRPRKTSFITTNFSDLRVQNNRKIDEFLSRDGTKVTAIIDSWLYDPAGLLRLEIKRSDFTLYYNQYLDRETNTSFTFKTASDIIFSFYKSETSEDSKYNVTMSWPTGLIVQPTEIGSSIYVKQSYFQVCRSRWKIEDEESRCYLKNGQIIIFRSNGDYDVLSGNGTKYTFFESSTIPRYEITSTTGEVWEVRTKGPCRSRRKLISRNRIFIGVDPKTHESFYKREDGVHSMLWQTGKLVTNYPDGTKITSTPYFEEDEIELEWTDEEKFYFEELVQRYKSEHSVQEPRSRTILRNGYSNRSWKIFEFEGFVSISCTYLMEHPKYSSVHVNPDTPSIRVTLPQSLSIIINPEGSYEIQQEKHYLRVYNTAAEFQTICNDCVDTSTVKLSFDSGEILCSVVDFFRKTVYVLRNGKMTFEDCPEELEERESDDINGSLKTLNPIICRSGHTKSPVTNHRCFALERDLSGVEFLHEDTIAMYSTTLPENTYYDHQPNIVADSSQTFSSHYSAAGYERWSMDYEDQYNSLPTNIKKKDLKELGVRQVPRNPFQYPFPKHHNCGNQQQKEKPKTPMKPPKLIVTRTFVCLSPDPETVVNEVIKYISAYQKQAQAIFKAYKDKKSEDGFQDSRYVEMRLRRIALALNPSLRMYSNLCIQIPSTEKEIHYFGHFTNTMHEIRSHTEDPESLLPRCKNVPVVLPRWGKFPPICEEPEITNSFFN